jgi:hypothetical protein
MLGCAAHGRSKRHQGRRLSRHRQAAHERDSRARLLGAGQSAVHWPFDKRPLCVDLEGTSTDFGVLGRGVRDWLRKTPDRRAVARQRAEETSER